MIRTRDFFLFLCTVVGLMVAIAISLEVTTVPQAGSQFGAALMSSAVDTSFGEPTDRPAVLSVPEEQHRAAALDAMRVAVAARLAETDVVIEPTTPETPEVVAVVDDALSSTEGVAEAVKQCPDYALAPWSDLPGIQFREAEGVRVLYRDLPVPVGAGTSTVADSMVLAQLPLAITPDPSPHCLPYDVVGVARDGSLIRNRDAELYAVFGPEVLIGYLLDGFPLYGASNLPTDACGGTEIAGSYRYYLSTKRDWVVSCFAATPGSL